MSVEEPLAEARVPTGAAYPFLNNGAVLASGRLTGWRPAPWWPDYGRGAIAAAESGTVYLAHGRRGAAEALIENNDGMSGLRSAAGDHAGLLVDVERLVGADDSERPDPSDPAQAVSFGTSGHRGSSLDGTFTESHIVAICDAIVRYRSAQGISGPLFWGRDTHALSGPAFSALRWRSGRRTASRRWSTPRTATRRHRRSRTRS